MVKEIRKHEAGNYLEQSGEFLESARDNLDKDRFNAAGFNAIQSMINANDALTIFFLEQRASKDHKEAVLLHVEVVRIINDSSCRGIFKEAMDLKSTAGYLGKSVSKGEAEKLLKNAIRFLEWVKMYVK
jgi:HEPN domain-containing protein